MKLRFTKMHGAGNDFVVLDGIRGTLPPLEGIAAQLADRRLGVGCDQILVARPSQSADFFMEIWNADGSRAEMCANGIRAFLKFVRDQGLWNHDEARVETLGGVVVPRWMGGDRVCVDMGRPILAPEKIPTRLRPASGDAAEGPVLDVPLDVEGRTLTLSSVSMGNPHAVLFVSDVDTAPVERLGPAIERHSAFPNRVNVEFVEVVSREKLRQRTWERGTGETLACGSGACAVAVVSILRGTTDRRVEIALRGGTLLLEWASPEAHVFMTGPAAEVFRGEIEVAVPGEGA
jgi:diaminopimelate epimerase